MDEWIRPRVQEWTETIDTLGRFAFSYPQAVYAGVAMSLKAEWQYLVLTVPGVGEYMGPVEYALANKFLTKILGLESILGRLRKLLYLGSKRAGIAIPNPIEVADKNTGLHWRTINAWWSP